MQCVPNWSVAHVLGPFLQQTALPLGISLVHVYPVGQSVATLSREQLDGLVNAVLPSGQVAEECETSHRDANDNSMYKTRVRVYLRSPHTKKVPCHLL